MMYSNGFVYLQTCKCERAEDVKDNFSIVINKLYEEVNNFTKNTYKQSSEKVNLVLTNNTKEIQKLKETLTQLQEQTNKVATEYGMSFYSHLIVDCKDAVEKKRELISRTIAESENICLLFIADVFTLVENPQLYKNISDAKLFIKDIDNICSNTATVKLAHNCYNHEIYIKAKEKFKDIERNTEAFLTNVDRKVNSKNEALTRCYSHIQKDVLNKQVRSGVREFRKCIIDKKNY